MRRVVVRHSPVHGNGVFALQPLKAGERILEYKGETVDWDAAIAKHRREGINGHTFFFGLEDGRVIDGSQGGNSARWINHACAPNCEAIEERGRVFIYALGRIHAGEELFIDYQLQTDEPVTKAVRVEYACRCGAAACRKSMLARR